MSFKAKLREQHRLESSRKKKNPETSASHNLPTSQPPMDDEVRAQNRRSLKLHSPDNFDINNAVLGFQPKGDEIGHAVPTIVVETCRDKKSNKLAVGMNG